MSATLERQINEFASALLKDVPVATAESITDRPLSISADPMPTRTMARLSGPVLATISFAAVVLIVLVATVALQGQPFGPATDTVTTTVQEVTPTTRALPVPSTTSPAGDLVQSGAINWVQVELPIEAVTAVSAGDRIYAVGEAFESIAHTTNGTDWTNHDTGVQMRPSTLAAWEDRLVAVGGGSGFSNEEDGPIRWQPTTVMIWNDATQEIENRSFSTNGESVAVGVGGPGVFVATSTDFHPEGFVEETFGRDDYVEIDVEGDDLIVIWADGSSDRVSAPEITAISSVQESSGWLTSDGSTWTPVPDLPASFDHVVGFEDGFLALGSGSAFFSSDGLTWNRIEGNVEGAWSEPTSMGDGIAFATESTIVTIDRFGSTAQPSRVQRPYSGFDRPIVTSGASTVAIFDLLERKYNYQQGGAEWTTSDLPETFPTANFGGWFTNAGAVTDELLVIGVYRTDAEFFTDIEWWVAEIPIETTR